MSLSRIVHRMSTPAAALVHAAWQVTTILARHMLYELVVDHELHIYTDHRYKMVDCLAGLHNANSTGYKLEPKWIRYNCKCAPNAIHLMTGYTATALIRHETVYITKSKS